MSLNIALLVPVAEYYVYDGTNGSEIVAFLEHPYDENRGVTTITNVSDVDGVLSFDWEGGYRNFANTAWEIYSNGHIEMATGSFIATQVGPGSFGFVPVDQVGTHYAVIANPEGA